MCNFIRLVMKKAVVYIRVSTSDQANSLEVQEQKAKDYCIYHGIEIHSVFVDEDISGSKPIYSRPSGSKIKELIKKGEINYVVVAKLDRAFRSTIDALTTVDLWNKEQISLSVIDMGGLSVDTASAAGKMVFTMLVAFSEFERSKTSERVKDVLSHKKANMKVYSRTPIGYDRKGDDLVINEMEQKTIELIFELSHKKYSLSQIAFELAARKIKPKNGNYWQRSSINYILQNSDYKKSA